MRMNSAKRSINGKLSRLVAFAVGTAMLFVAGFGCWQETYRYLAGKRDVLLATASAFAAAGADAVASHDGRGAFLAIRGIGSVPGIEFASLADATGKVLADVGSGVRLAGDLDLTEADATSSPLALLGTRTVSVTVPVLKGGGGVGRLKLVGHVTDLWSRLRDVLWTTALGAIAALLIGLAISLRLQRQITRPLITLARAMTAIRTSHDYDTRVAVESDDEVGLLATSFTDMLGEVRERDRQLVAHRDRLEHDVTERTQDLRLAKEDAEAANVAKSTFLATMSHEIRTPMTGLLVMAELLASGDLPARSRRHAEVICKSGTALLAIINDILDFSKIEAGKLETEKVRVDARDVVNTVIALFHSRAVEKGLDLAARFTPEVPRAIEGDPTRLQQVVSNLVNNALKFTKSGYVMVDVRYEDGSLVCAVDDTGIGIAPDKLDRIFQAFSQADGSTTREFGGTGLGLSISSRLAEAMGGAIAVASQPGVGSTFTCTVPAPLIEPARPATAGRGGRALVSLARPATARAVAAVLVRRGYHVAGPAASAASDAEEESADLLIVDRGSLDSLAGASAAVVCLGESGDVGLVGAATRASHLLRLPFVEGDLEAILDGIALGAAPASPVPVRKDQGSEFAGARVLVADDMAVNREVMIEALRRFGIVPALVANGLEAVAAAAAHDYDLVFMDGSMPELDGFEACRRIRACEESRGAARRTPILALTAHVVGTAAGAWRDAGMDGVLRKPFTMAELQQALAAHLGPQARTRDDAGSTARATSIDAAASQASIEQPQEDTPDNDVPLLDGSVLAEIAAMSQGSKHDFGHRVFKLFIEHAPRSWLTLRAAEEAGDHHGLASAAHAIKSMSLNIGARQASRAAAAVERAARCGTVVQADIELLDDAIIRTCAELAKRLSHEAASPIAA